MVVSPASSLLAPSGSSKVHRIRLRLQGGIHRTLTEQQNSRVWFITDASRGFGALISREALPAGDNVVATARNSRSVISEIGEHPSLLALDLDGTDEAQARQAAAAAVEHFGAIDVLLTTRASAYWA